MIRYFLPLVCGTGLVWAQAGDGATVTGKVVDATTKEGIRKATVTATRSAAPTRSRPVNAGPPEMVSVRTDDSGAYRLPGLPAGDYFLTAERQGYLPAALNARTNVTAKAGQETAAAELKLTRYGVITGRVVDADGDPAEFVSIQAIPAGGGAAAVQMMGLASATTDDRGEFRMARLAPGSYRLLAVSGKGQNVTRLAQGPEQPMLDAPTYFPATLDESSAAKVTVGSGEERTGIEIRLQQSAVVRVSGKVDGEFPRDLPIPVSLQPLGTRNGSMVGFRPGRFGSNNHGLANAEGHFVISNVLPGEYLVTASSHNRGLTQSGYTKIRVGQQDLDGVQLHLQQPGRIVGHVSAAESGKQPPKQFHIGLQTAEPGMPGGGGAMVKADDTFVMDNVMRMRLRLLPTAPKGWYLKSVLVGNQPLPGKEFDLVGPETRLELVYSDKPGSVEGTVSDIEGNALVVLVPEGAENEPSPGQWFKNGIAKGEQGAFQIDSVAPGVYSVIACPPGVAQTVTDPAIWAKVKEKAVRVTVEEKKAATASLRAVLAADLEEK